VDGAGGEQSRGETLSVSLRLKGRCKGNTSSLGKGSEESSANPEKSSRLKRSSPQETGGKGVYDPSIDAPGRVGEI